VARKATIPARVRREVLLAAGAVLGETRAILCHWCGAVAGMAHGFLLRDGRPSLWLSAPGVDLDHVLPESHGGETSTRNLVASCYGCNRSKGARLDWVKA
jgi:5-methylcytosine-specific restriction endonuclease McrA